MVPVDQDQKEVLISIDSPLYEAVLTSRGAKIISFKLKKFRATLDGPELVNLFDVKGDTAGPSLVFTSRKDEVTTDAELNYQTDFPKQAILSEADEKSITFQTTTSSGVIIAKTYTFRGGSYEVGFSFQMANTTNESRNYSVSFPWRKIFKGEDDRFAWNSVELYLNSGLKDYYFKDIKGDEELSGQIEWAGLGDVYFFKALVFDDKPNIKVSLIKPSKDIAEIKVRFGAIDLDPGQTEKRSLAIYLGPKQRDALLEAGNNLSNALVYSYYRIFDIMAEWLMIVLRFFNSGFTVFGIRVPGTNNFGIDIIILTILIKILFIPLSHKSMKSMKRMQELQPQMAKLKEKYKDDKAAFNKAMMEMYKEKKINPAGGCLPMLAQLPVFVALYQALSYAVELRHAPFVCFPSIFLCINDLSAPDPYYVTPILMGATMALQQWLTPAGGDPTQKKMMMILPVVFTYLFISFPAGLVLYWLVNNILSIAQQVVTNRMAD
jgi:YidC/Oxa1 family membrane protein insertase